MVCGIIIGTSFLISSFASSLDVLTFVLALFAGECTLSIETFSGVIYMGAAEGFDWMTLL